MAHTWFQIESLEHQKPTVSGFETVKKTANESISLVWKGSQEKNKSPHSNKNRGMNSVNGIWNKTKPKREKIVEFEMLKHLIRFPLKIQLNSSFLIERKRSKEIETNKKENPFRKIENYWFVLQFSVFLTLPLQYFTSPVTDRRMRKERER